MSGQAAHKRSRAVRIGVQKDMADRDLAVANAEKAKYEAAKAKTEAEAAASDAAFPAPQTAPPDGAIQLGDKTGLIADLLTHALLDRSVGEATEVLGAKLSDSARVLVIEDRDLIASDWSYAAIDQDLTGLTNGLRAALSQLKGDQTKGWAGTDELVMPAFARSALPPGVVGAEAVTLMGETASVIGSVADLAQMFRSSYDVKARDVSVSSGALLASVAKHLLGKTEEVNVDGLGVLDGSGLLRRFNDAAALRDELQQAAGRLQDEVLAPIDHRQAAYDEVDDAYLAALKVKSDDAPSAKSLDKLEAIRTERERDLDEAKGKAADARVEVAAAQAAIRRFEDFAALVSKGDGKWPPLVAAAVRERLHSDDGYTHVLFPSVEAAAGEVLTRRTILRTTIRFVGGLNLSALLWSVSDQRIVAAYNAPTAGSVDYNMAAGVAKPIRMMPLAEIHQERTSAREIPLGL